MELTKDTPPLVSTPLNQLRDRELSEVETRQAVYSLTKITLTPTDVRLDHSKDLK